MGKGGKSKSSSESRSGSNQLWARPFAIGGINAVNSVYNQNAPGLQKMTDTVQNDLVPSMLAKYKGSLGNVDAANAHTGDILSGKFLNGNPYLDQILGKMRGDIADSVNSQFSLSGRYGSGAHTGVLADSMNEAEGALRYQNYATEMDRMGQAAQSAQATNAADSAQTLAAIGAGAEIPYVGSSNLANSLAALFNGSYSENKQTESGPGLLGQLIAGASNAAAAYAQTQCDIRLKENIELDHVEPDGLAFYRFDYIKGRGLPEGRQLNPMAQDVARIRPWALGPNTPDGFMTIYPAKL